MIQEQTYLEVADNSGARKLMCIRVLGGSKKRIIRFKDFSFFWSVKGNSQDQRN